MPVRGAFLRALSAALTRHRAALGQLVSLETGKILSEGVGEVQEAIDVCDFAAGLSRSIDGSTFPSERANHLLMERWHPLRGHVGVISAFNFPCAVFFWNCALSLLMGNTTIWKGQPRFSALLRPHRRLTAIRGVLTRCLLCPAASVCSETRAFSGCNAALACCALAIVGLNFPFVCCVRVQPSETTLLTAIASVRIISDTLQEAGHSPGLVTLCGGGSEMGEALANDRRVDLLSFTGSTAVAKRVNVAVAQRMGRTLLEAGGNNALILLEDADLELAKRAVLFAAVGTAGQRCTSLRRLFVHTAVYDRFVPALVAAYKTIRIGDPLDPSTLCGPLHTARARDNYRAALERIRGEGGVILTGGKVRPGRGFYVEPTVVEMRRDSAMMQEELFAPVLYVVRVDSLEEAIELQNGVRQGLSSALFSNDIRRVMHWIGPEGCWAHSYTPCTYAAG